MHHVKFKIALFVLSILVLSSCFSVNTPMATPKICATSFMMLEVAVLRLFIYEQSGTRLIAHSGPKIEALATPLYVNNPSQMTDIDNTVNDVISTLDLIRRDGALDNGFPKWIGFDWVNQCNMVSAKIYATAGMRIAQQTNPRLA